MTESHDLETEVDLDKSADKKGDQGKRRELMELRIRKKVADEHYKKMGDERKDLKERVDALMLEMKKTPREPKKGSKRAKNAASSTEAT